MQNNYIDACVSATSFKYKKIETVIKKSLESGVLPLIVSSSKNSNLDVEKFSELPITLGIHPYASQEVEPEYFDKEFLEIVKQNKNCVAIGECGLDYEKVISEKDQQIKIFEKQIEVAKELALPLYLHERGAKEDFIKILKDNNVNNGIVHCFTGDIKTVIQYQDLGLYIGITGWLCDEKRNQELKKAVCAIRPDRLILETDSPYLKPKQSKEKENYPWNIKYIAEKLEEILGIDKEIIIAQAKDNTKELFGI